MRFLLVPSMTRSPMRSVTHALRMAPPGFVVDREESAVAVKLVAQLVAENQREAALAGGLPGLVARSHHNRYPKCPAESLTSLLLSRGRRARRQS